MERYVPPPFVRARERERQREKDRERHPRCLSLRLRLAGRIHTHLIFENGRGDTHTNSGQPAAGRR
eukprot:COSAG03_NODE_5590_length_1214_cov_7.628700_2_plen_66_part_00